MKVCFLYIAVFGLFYGSARAQTYELDDDLLELLAVVPLGDLQASIESAIQNNGEVQELVTYLRSSEYQNVINIILADIDIDKLRQFLLDAKVDIVAIAAGINAAFGPVPDPPLEPQSGGVLSLYNELLLKIDIDIIIALLLTQLQNSPDVQELYRRIEGLQNVFHNLYILPEFQAVVSRLVSYGLDIDAVIQGVKGAFGWE